MLKALGDGGAFLLRSHPLKKVILPGTIVSNPLCASDSPGKLLKDASAWTFSFPEIQVALVWVLCFKAPKAIGWITLNHLKRALDCRLILKIQSARDGAPGSPAEAKWTGHLKVTFFTELKQKGLPCHSLRKMRPLLIACCESSCTIQSSV